MFPLLNPSAGDAFSGAIFDQNPCKINEKQWIPWFGRTGTPLKRTSVKRWLKKWYSNVWAMKSDQFRTKSSFFGSFRMWQKHCQNMPIYWREALKKPILEQNAEIVPSAFLGTFLSRFFCCILELFWASRRFSLLQTLCARRYEKRTQQAELVGKNIRFMLKTRFRYEIGRE